MVFRSTLSLLVGLTFAGCHALYPFDPGPAVDGEVQRVDVVTPLDAPSPADARVDWPRDFVLIDSSVKPADHAQPQDKLISHDKMILPDKKILPDKMVPADKMIPLDKMVPPDKGFSCGSLKNFSETTGSTTGWFKMAGGSNQVQVLASKLKWPTNLYGSAGRSDSAGLVCVPQGMGLKVELTCSCTSGSFNMSIYELYCDASSCNTTQILHVCPFVCSSSTSSSVQLCNVPASKVQGRWIRAVRISRGAGASDGLVSWAKLEPQ